MLRFGGSARVLVTVVLGLAVGAVPAGAAPGDLDGGFATGGVYTAPFQTTFAIEGSQEVAVDSQGRVYLGATVGAAVPRQLAVQRLSPQGVVDTGYGTGGTATLPIPGDTRLAGLEIDGQGRAVLAGVNGEATSAAVAVARLTSVGQPDPSFSSDGWEVTALPGTSTAAPDGVALDENDRPLIVATITIGCPGGGCSIGGMVARFTTAGALDGGYGAAGVRQVGDAGMRMGGIVALPGGGAYAAGYDDYESWVVGRLTGGGALDSSFDGDGLASTALGQTLLDTDTVSLYGVAVDAQNRPILAGQYTTGTATATLARFTSAGAPDGTFGGTPVAGATFLAGITGARARTPVVCGNRILVAGGASRPGNTNGLFVAALAEGGALDPTFAPGAATPGIATLPLGNYNIGLDLARQGAGVLAAGFRRFPLVDDRPTLARFSAACGDEPSGGGGPTPPAPTPPAAPASPSATPPAPKPAVTVAAAVAFPPTKACASRRKFSIRLRVPRDANVVQATVLVNGKQGAVRKGARLRSSVDLRNLPKGRFRVEVRLKLSDGRTIKDGRRYRTCAPKKKNKKR